MSKFEIRSTSEIRATDEGLLVGYAAVFNKPSHDLGGFVEIIEPGAFARSLQEDYSGIQALFEHNPEKILATTQAGTLHIAEDEHGLRVEIDPADTSYARDMIALVRRGDIGGMSFRFRPHAGGASMDIGTSPPLRTLRSVQLAEVSVVGNPAYPDTSLSLRDLEGARLHLIKQAERQRRLRLADV
jgi:uncharacterized protein